VHLYAHFQFDSVPQRLRGGRVRVEKGELLGKVGNSGASSAPHLHFGILKHRRFIAPGDARFILRPMPFTDMHSVKSAEAKIGDANASWFKHTNHGLSQAAWPDRCLIWPAAGKPSL
jgi:murein DD-endopeptidase MepM/ murein hydrolase activator NlpD